MRLLNLLNKTIEYSFYLLFFLVPLALTGDTSELFEFNKLWVTFILSTVIAVAWISKMIVKREFRIQRTILDIPIILFLGSQILSTIFSLDIHTSLWGYYSRFNGGLISIISYIFLYYAFVSNFKDIQQQYEKEESKIKLSSILLFVGAVIIFFVGNYLASLLINVDATSLIPFQMLTSLVAAVISFALILKAAPAGFIKRSFYMLLSTAAFVLLWGLPSHFGYDPTCLLFRGKLDVACWTDQFQPKIRMFSTLGQPDWLGAYLVALTPLLVAIFVNFVGENKFFEKGKKILANLKNYNLLLAVLLLLFIGASYLTILYTVSRAAVLGIWVSFFVLGFYYFWVFIRPKFDIKRLTPSFKIAAFLVVFVYLLTFLNGQPFSQLDIFTWKGIHGRFFVPKTSPSKPQAQVAKPAPTGAVGELGGTDSGKIRLFVWEGAIDIWKHYPVFGSGVETYAFAYYQFKPLGHNLTSEWNYLYNKAHNEYLNYLATTGTVGIIAYLTMIGAVLFFTTRFLLKNQKPTKENLIVASLLSGYIGILVTNFFGFSVVFINILFYLFPGLILLTSGLINFDQSFSKDFSMGKKQAFLSPPQKGLLILALIAGLYTLFVLVRFWQADRYYYYGLNYDQSGNYQQAYTYLQKAVDFRPSEPTFRDEYALNNAILAAGVIYQNQESRDQQTQNLAKQLIDSAISNSDKLLNEHPNNIVFVKNRVRLLYTLSQVDPSYLPKALGAIKKAKVLAPTDADISYNLGVLLGQTGDLKGGIRELERTVELKPNYPNGNAYYALGLFYHQLALDKNGKIVNQEFAQKALEEMKTILKIFGANDQAQNAIDTWSKGQ